jgi:hypothetical protein
MRPVVGLLARIEKLEERRRPVLRAENKESRDARVRAVLSDPQRIIEIRERLLGPGNEHYAPNRLAAIMAGLRADR